MNSPDIAVSAEDVPRIVVAIAEKLDGHDRPEKVIAEHRLAQHLLRFAQLLPAKVFQAAKNVAASEVQKIGRMREDLRLIQSYFPGALMIKGPTVHMLLELPGLPRVSNDIDIVGVSDFELREAGFRWSSSVPHESGVWRKSGFTKLDSHRYFPMWQIGESGELDLGVIPESLILAHRINNPVEGLPDIVDMPMAALISAAHLFKSGYEYPVWKWARVRLGELLDFILLVTDSRFPRSTFDSLCAETSAYGAVSLAFEMALSLTDKSRIADIAVEWMRGHHSVISMPASALAWPGETVGALRSSTVPRVVLRHDPLVLNPSASTSWTVGDQSLFQPRLRVEREDGGATVWVELDGAGTDYRTEVLVSFVSGAVLFVRDENSTDFKAICQNGGNAVRIGAFEATDKAIAGRLHMDASIDFIAVSCQVLVSRLGSDWESFYGSLGSWGICVEL